MTRSLTLTACFCFLCALVVADPAPKDSLVTLILDPAQVHVSTFYQGTDVHVSAKVGECDGAVLLLTAGEEEETLNRKGRVAGIWLNVAQVTVSHVPRVYILGTSDKLENICSPEVQRELGLGEESLREQLKFTCEKPLTGSEFDEFLKLKVDNGTYNMNVKVELVSTGSGQKELSAILPVPPTVPPGNYTVLLYCFKDGKPVKRGSAELSIVRVGLARVMASLAYSEPAVYGVVAIVVAMIVGIGMGLIFSSRPGSGH
jgi:uncharacterized protein (TIGR02186 family)